MNLKRVLTAPILLLLIACTAQQGAAQAAKQPDRARYTTYPINNAPEALLRVKRVGQVTGGIVDLMTVARPCGPRTGADYPLRVTHVRGDPFRLGQLIITGMAPVAGSRSLRTWSVAIVSKKELADLGGCSRQH